MYTQCPECQTAFRVTAQVLQQAAGRVRCGGCGNAFNALQSLSEEMPSSAPGDAAAQTTDRDRALLESLNELAGPEEVRIEDTGIEWRVVGGNDVEPQGANSESIPEVDDDVAVAAAAPMGESIPAPAPLRTEEMRFDDNTLLPDDFGEETEDIYRPPEIPARRAEDQIEPPPGDIDDVQVDLALGEPDEWEDLLDEVADAVDDVVGDETDDDGTTEAPAAAPGDAGGRNIPLEVEEELAAIHNELSAMPESASAEPADLDAQFERQAEAMGIDVTGSREAAPEALPFSDDTLAERILQHEELVDVGERADEQQAPEAVPGPTGEELALVEEAADDRSGPVLESTDEFDAQIEAARRALAGDEPASDEQPEEDRDGEDLSALDGILIVDDEATEPEQPPASTQAEPEAARDARIDEEPPDAAQARESGGVSPLDDPAALFDEDSPEVETIVMEGDFVSASLEEKAREARAREHMMQEAQFLADTYARNRGMVRGGRRKTDPPGFGVIAGVAVLALVLLAQVMHASRQSLSTYGAFNQTIGPVYRMLGSPVTPQWDVKGWQFQATNGATDDNEAVLTIFSRIVNRSEQALPYPLVHVSLTDRWEEIIGSRVLEPSEYLAGDLDPSIPVAPGENFTAVITIESPSANATGFKLNVCYRVAEDRVRCATEDFKD